MREILFRGKAINREPDGEYRTDYKNGDWVYGLLTKMWNEEFPNLPAEMTNESGTGGIEIDHKTIGQYTGLNDKTGKKIFEGDIVKAVYKSEYVGVPDHEWGNGVVEYDGSYYGRASFKMNMIGKIGSRIFSASVEVEVIGNVYDNPELMKGVNNETDI